MNKETFAKMVEMSFQKKKKLEKGSEFKSVIKECSNDFIFIQSIDKSVSGVIPREEFDVSPKIGSIIDAYFIDEVHGDYHFTTCLLPENINQETLELALSAKIPVLGQVISSNESGLEIKVGSITAFCPISHIDPNLKKEDLKGKKLKFLIQELNKGKNVIVSQKSFSEKERQYKIDILKNELQVGSIISCKIKSIHPRVLILDINGLKGVIHYSEATYKKNVDLNQEFKIGQIINAKILDLDWVNGISLSLKDFIQNPWTSNLPFQVGDIIHGVIDSLKPFGIFVKIDDHFNGLIPLKETGLDFRQPANQHFKPGDKVEAFVQEIKFDKKQISLSIQKAKELKDRMEYTKYLTNDRDQQTASMGDFFKKKK